MGDNPLILPVSRPLRYASGFVSLKPVEKIESQRTPCRLSIGIKSGQIDLICYSLHRATLHTRCDVT